jgi:hypothetical protein
VGIEPLHKHGCGFIIHVPQAGYRYAAWEYVHAHVLLMDRIERGLLEREGDFDKALGEPDMLVIYL